MVTSPGCGCHVEECHCFAVIPGPTEAEYCASGGHGFYGTEWDCENGAQHRADEPCRCGRCYCGERRYDRHGNPA